MTQILHAEAEVEVEEEVDNIITAVEDMVVVEVEVEEVIMEQGER